MNKKRFPILLSGIIIFLFLSCESPSETFLTSPDGRIPVITGLRLIRTDESGNVVGKEMVWRSPNPNHSNMALYFGDENKQNNLFMYAIPKTALVQLYFIKARLPEEDPVVNFVGSSTNLDYTLSVHEVLNEIQSAGNHTISIDKTAFEKSGFGFYQMYFKTDSWSMVTDCVIFQSKDDIPADLYELLMKFYRQE